MTTGGVSLGLLWYDRLPLVYETISFGTYLYLIKVDLLEVNRGNCKSGPRDGIRKKLMNLFSGCIPVVISH